MKRHSGKRAFVFAICPENRPLGGVVYKIQDKGENFYNMTSLCHIIGGMIELYCRPPGFTVVPPGKYLAGGLKVTA
ncbi:MAG TPA: hypothetical protein DCZ91_22745 [Lachnospiraceae bacterium]|nr:hypothetical protein [Lachnospiraceae bacterium]